MWDTLAQRFHVMMTIDEHYISHITYNMHHHNVCIVILVWTQSR